MSQCRDCTVLQEEFIRVKDELSDVRKEVYTWRNRVERAYDAAEKLELRVASLKRELREGTNN